jgi:hypothetical protein
MTIAGAHTIAETKNLQARTEWRVDGLNDALAKVKRENPHAIDADPSLVADWDSFLARWVDAKAWAKTKYVGAMLVNPLLGPDVIPDEDSYQAILRATSLTYPLYTDKDLPGLQQRIIKVGGVVTNGDPPKDWVALDLDLKAYKAADTGAKAITAVKETAQETARDFVSENKTAILTTVALGGLALYFANKYKLL